MGGPVGRARGPYEPVDTEPGSIWRCATRPREGEEISAAAAAPAAGPGILPGACASRWKRVAALLLLPAVVLTIGLGLVTQGLNAQEMSSVVASRKNHAAGRKGPVHAEIFQGLRARAGRGSHGRSTDLQTTMLWKFGWFEGSPDEAQSQCVGYEQCPEFPLPYPYKTLPESYNYSGKFPDEFIWGLGTAAYQIEGAYKEDGRGASIWDTFTGANTLGMPGANCSYCCKEAPCPVNPAMGVPGATGNVANDHYHMYPVDIALMKSMGLKHYRFSIAWPRIVPTGKISDGVNEKGIDFYNQLIDALIEADITPYATLYHWDLPQGLMDPPRINGWWSRDKQGKPDGAMTQHFVDYADICFKHFGDRVKTWMTFNEAWTFTYLASGWGKAPSIKEFDNHSVDVYVSGHNVLLAHAKAVELYRQKYQKQQGGQIGMVNNCDWREPKTDQPEDVAAAARTVEFWLGWMADPVYFGDYPPAMRQIYGDRLPNFTEEESKLLNGSVDFFALNSYGVGFAAYNPEEPGNDLTWATITEEGIPQGQSAWLFGQGWGLRKLVNWVKRRYGNPPIYVTEGGWSLQADSSGAGARDPGRVYYYANYTEELLRAIRKDNVDVRGYFAWSLMDNFEWERGYLERFGTTFNEFRFGRDDNAPKDQDNQPTAGRQYRRRKDSGCWLEAVWRSGALVDPATFQGCVNSSALEGQYHDKSAKSCKRTIKIMSFGSVEVAGTTASAGGEGICTGSSSDHVWTEEAMVDGGSIVIEKSKKSSAHHDDDDDDDDAVKSRGFQGIHGFWDLKRKGIQWSDGSFWEKVVSSSLAEDEEEQDEDEEKETRTKKSSNAKKKDDESGETKTKTDEKKDISAKREESHHQDDDDDDVVVEDVVEDVHEADDESTTESAA